MIDKNDIIVQLHYGFGDAAVAFPTIISLAKDTEYSVHVLYPQHINDFMVFFKDTFPSNVILKGLPCRGHNMSGHAVFMLESPEYEAALLTNRYVDLSPANAWSHPRSEIPKRQVTQHTKRIALYPITADVTVRHIDAEMPTYRKFINDFCTYNADKEIVVIGSEKDHAIIGFHWIYDDLRKYSNVRYMVGKQSVYELCQTLEEVSHVYGVHGGVTTIAPLFGAKVTSWLLRDVPTNDEFVRWDVEQGSVALNNRPWKFPMYDVVMEQDRSVHVIFRACDNNNVHGGLRVTQNKTNLTLACLLSIKTTGYKITVILDDRNSSDVLLNTLSSLAAEGCIELRLLSPNAGNNDSMKLAYDIASKSDADILYFVEDDYYHEANAVLKMGKTLTYLEKHTAEDCAIFPCDDPCEYKQHEPSYITTFANRHWRTVKHTTFTVMISRLAFMKHASTFDGLSDYGKHMYATEANTINTLWSLDGQNALKPKVRLFAPLPAIATHVQNYNTLPYVKTAEQKAFLDAL